MEWVYEGAFMNETKKSDKDTHEKQSKDDKILFQNIQQLKIDEDIDQINAEERYEEF